MSDYRYQIVKCNEIDCLHVMIDSNSHVEIAHTYIPMDDIQASFRNYGFKTQEYTDDQTGVRITVERDGSEYPKITLFPPEPCTLEVEEINEALRRLLEMSAMVIEYHQIAQPDLHPVPLAQKILDIMQGVMADLNFYAEDSLHEAIDDIVKLCREQLERGRSMR